MAFKLQLATRERHRAHLLSHLPVNPPYRPPATEQDFTGIDPNFNTQIRIMSELKQYHPNLRVLRIKQTQNGWIFIGDTPKDFAILHGKPKMQQVLGEIVNVSQLPKSYHSADDTKGKFLVFRGRYIRRFQRSA